MKPSVKALRLKSWRIKRRAPEITPVSKPKSSPPSAAMEAMMYTNRLC
jgi:hypothetical protein